MGAFRRDGNCRHCHHPDLFHFRPNGCEWEYLQKFANMGTRTTKCSCVVVPAVSEEGSDHA